MLFFTIRQSEDIMFPISHRAEHLLHLCLHFGTEVFEPITKKYIWIRPSWFYKFDNHVYMHTIC